MPIDTAMFDAAVDLVRRTGSVEFVIREVDSSGEVDHPTVFVAFAMHRIGEFGRPVPDGQPGRPVWTVGAGLGPIRAVLALADDLIDGGECVHCHRPTGVTEDIAPMPASAAICWYQWDPELGTFRRGCEGTT